MLVSLLVLFIAEVFIILSSHQLSRSILRLTRKVSQLSDPAAIAERPLLPEEMPKVTNPRDVEMRELEDVFDKQVMELKTAMRNDAELRESNLRSRLNALQAQINPHFIYNTLNIISAKSMEAGNEEVIDICGKFAQMLRYSTDLRSKTATLQEEIAHVRNYLGTRESSFGGSAGIHHRHTGRFLASDTAEALPSAHRGKRHFPRLSGVKRHNSHHHFRHGR